MSGCNLGTNGRARQARGRVTKASDPLSRVARSTSSVSRVLFCTRVAPGAAAVIPLGRPLPDASSSLPASSGESPFAGSSCEVAPHARLCGLAPDGVCLAVSVTGDAVGSYPAVSPFPAASVSSRDRWSLLCCTFLRVSATGRYPASCSLELGLSSRRASRPLACASRSWFTTGDRLYGIDETQRGTGSRGTQLRTHAARRTPQ